MLGKLSKLAKQQDGAGGNDGATAAAAKSETEPELPMVEYKPSVTPTISQEKTVSTKSVRSKVSKKRMEQTQSAESLGTNEDETRPGTQSDGPPTTATTTTTAGATESSLGTSDITSGGGLTEEGQEMFLGTGSEGDIYSAMDMNRMLDSAGNIPSTPMILSPKEFTTEEERQEEFDRIYGKLKRMESSKASIEHGEPPTPTNLYEALQSNFLKTVSVSYAYYYSYDYSDQTWTEEVQIGYRSRMQKSRFFATLLINGTYTAICIRFGLLQSKFDSD